MSFSAILQGFALGLGVAIGGDHNYRNIGPYCFGFWQHLKTAHPRHVDVGQDQDDRYARCISDALKRRRSRLGKVHRETARAEIVPELLAEQQLNVRRVVNHENEKVHDQSPIWQWLQRYAAE